MNNKIKAGNKNQKPFLLTILIHILVIIQSKNLEMTMNNQITFINSLVDYLKIKLIYLRYKK